MNQSNSPRQIVEIGMSVAATSGPQAIAISIVDAYAYLATPLLGVATVADGTDFKENF
jgi:hypothetical protein